MGEQDAFRMDHLGKAPHATRIVVAMSGGVDSSVVAAMLKAAGYDVVGMTLQLYDVNAGSARKGACCAGRDIHDARTVAAALDIPHYVLDYEDLFRRKVVDPFVASYEAGETPVPCVACNSSVKFADLFQTARTLGADFLATGHYLDLRRDPAGHLQLHRARDTSRDQSYFLYTTQRELLDGLLFPLGAMTKAEVRAQAALHRLPVADKPDSQDICFVPNGRYADVIRKLAPAAAKPGVIRHIDGRVLGRHDGIIDFTVGQRRGLRLGAETGSEPLFVVSLDAGRQEVIVGPREALRTTAIDLRDINWLGDGALLDGMTHELFVRVRSTRQPVPGRLTLDASGAHVRLVSGEDAVSPGQACVFYDSDAPDARLLGGGTIRAAHGAATIHGHREPAVVC